ncbi:MAG: hypothetical protein AAF577_17125 [Pseudomonadota bacterium]
MPKDQAIPGEEARDQALPGADDSDDGEGMATDSPTVAEQRPMSRTEWAMLFAG